MNHAQKATRRLLAGLCIEANLADRKIVNRWQASVKDGSFDPDACAAEILEQDGPAAEQNSQILARAGGLERDFLMMSQQTGIKGATRRAKRAGKGFMAYALANLIAIGAYSLGGGALMVLLRYHYKWSYDGIIDKAVGWVEGLL